MEIKNLRRLLSFARRAVQDYDMIEDGDVIAVGVSGGKDSLALLLTLKNLSIFYPKHFEVCGITVDMGFEGTDFSPVEKLCEDIGVRYKLVKTDLADIIFKMRNETNPCALCAKMRRGIIHDSAKEMGANKVALGHNFDDMLETFMMNLFNEGRIASFSPVTYLDRKDITVIRPLALAPEKDIVYFMNQNPDLPLVKSLCPEDKHTDREKYKQMLYAMERERDGTMHRLFEAIKKADVDGWGTDNRMYTGERVRFYSEDIEKTAEYYKEMLGFYAESYEENGKRLVLLSAGNTEIELSDDADTCQMGVRIMTARLDSLYGSLLKKGAVITKKPSITPFGNREMEIEDCDGRRIIFSVKIQ